MAATPFLQIREGIEVVANGRRGVVTRLVNLDTVLVRDAETGETRKFRVAELRTSAPTPGHTDLERIPDHDWQIANQRLEIILPLLGKTDRNRAEVEERAASFNLHVNTVYKWISAYQETGLLTSLMPKTRSDKGAQRLDLLVEDVIKAVIEEFFLTPQRMPISKVCAEVRNRCLRSNVTPPHPNTVRNRITAISQSLQLTKRASRRAAEQKFSPIEGSFPGADWPLAVVQIDHTKIDLILVDDVHRRPIGRPWLTLAIDVFSRMVTGFYVSFDPPGALSVGLCIAHSALAKEPWLLRTEVDGEWPVWGLPRTFHVDNAREFRGQMLDRACQQYGINIEWRPVARPHFGSHIERLLGTLAREIHTLPGTTFSNPAERGDYPSEQRAVMTLREFETWLTTFVVQVYHRRVHSMLGVSPFEKFQQGILGTATRPGTGLPARVADEQRLRLDFLPYKERTIQNYGVVIDEIHYYHDVLRAWINAPDPVHPRHKRKFLFRFDPRDLSVIWFWDPVLNAHFPIPYRDTSHPPVSIWELKEMSRVVESSKQPMDERALFEAYDRMRTIEQEAASNTKAARRAAQRRRFSAPDLPRSLPLPAITDAVAPDKPPAPFDELDDLSSRTPEDHEDDE